MIYLFTGDNNFLVFEEIKKWKNVFVEKNGDFDLHHYKDISNISDGDLISNLTSLSFLGGKKFIIIDSIPSEANDKNPDIKTKQELILSVIEKIPSENIVIFNSGKPDKRGKIYKKILELGELKQFNSGSNLESIISKKYGNNITREGINLIIKYKSSNLSKIVSELDKLFITQDRVDENIIKKYILPELEESIFLLIDDILSLNIPSVIEKMNIILSDTNIYAFYNNLVANLRTNLYINNLKNIGISSNKISDLLSLGNKSFLVNKSYKMKFNVLNSLFISLVNLDKKMKSGNMKGSDESNFKYELEKIFLNLDINK